MNREELRAFGAVFRVLTDAIEGAGGTVTATDRNRMYERPLEGLAVLHAKAMAESALDDEDMGIISALTDEIGSPEGGRLSLEDQGHVILGYQSYGQTVGAEDAADELGITKQRVYKLVDDGLLRGYKVRGRWRVTRASLDRRKADMGL